MNDDEKVSEEQVDSLFKRLDKQAQEGGYHLNPDTEHTKELIRSLIINEKRYGYWACPCRLADGQKEEDLDIICPCDYRDADLLDYDTCFCALYVSKDVVDGKKDIESISERRPDRDKRLQFNTKKTPKQEGDTIQGTLPIWRCRVCGYLCAREQPPAVCPICKAKQDRFELFVAATS